MIIISKVEWNQENEKQTKKFRSGCRNKIFGNKKKFVKTKNT